MIKTRNRGEFSQLDKEHLQKIRAAKIMLNNMTLETFHINEENKVFSLTIPIQHCPESSR